MLNQGRIALLAAILLFVLYIRSFAGEALTAVSSGATGSYAASLLLRFLVFMALPVMLAVWFRSGASIELSEGLGWVAVGTAVVLGAFFVLGMLTAVVRFFGGPVAGAAPGRQGLSVWLIFRLLSDAALVLLSIALSRRSADAAPVRTSGFRPLRHAALAATIAAVRAFVLNTTQLVESAKLQIAPQYGMLLETQGGHLDWVDRPTVPQIALGFVVGSLLPLCRLMIPLIVYRSLSVLRREDPGADPGSPQRA
jgi:hypothetical protein